MAIETRGPGWHPGRSQQKITLRQAARPEYPRQGGCCPGLSPPCLTNPGASEPAGTGGDGNRNKENAMYFTIERASGGYRARAYGANHELVWWTEVYVQKSGAQSAINMLKARAPGAPVYDRT